MTTTIRESATLTGTGQSGNMLVTLITPGVGSSGVYPAEVLEAAAAAKVFPAGTLSFADHPGDAEAYDRPERSIKDLAAVLVEDARWEGGELVAEVKPFGPWKDVLAEMKDAIGVSIRAQATLAEAADPDTGKPVIESIDKAISVDFVTQAGRGGRIREVYESARQRSPLVVRETTIVEATADERREQLTTLVKDAHGGGESIWSYVQDYDDDRGVVWFSVETGDDHGLWQQSYTVDDDVATALTGTRIEVRRVTTYVPVIPAGQSTTTQESEEDTMPQIEESRLAQLEADAGRVTVLESKVTEAVQRAEKAEADLAEARKVANTATAERVVREAFDAAGVTAPKTAARLAAAAPLTESGEVDTDALKTAAEESATELAEASGVGRVHGLGGGTQSTGGGDGVLSESDIDDAIGGAFGTTVKEA